MYKEKDVVLLKDNNHDIILSIEPISSYEVGSGEPLFYFKGRFSDFTDNDIVKILNEDEIEQLWNDLVRKYNSG